MTVSFRREPDRNQCGLTQRRKGAKTQREEQSMPFANLNLCVLRVSVFHSSSAFHSSSMTEI